MFFVVVELREDDVILNVKIVAVKVEEVDQEDPRLLLLVFVVQLNVLQVTNYQQYQAEGYHPKVVRGVSELVVVHYNLDNKINGSQVFVIFQIVGHNLIVGQVIKFLEYKFNFNKSDFKSVIHFQFNIILRLLVLMLLDYSSFFDLGQL